MPKIQRRELRQCFLAAVDIFHTMLLKTRETVDSALQLTKTQIQARWSCPGCFGPNSPEDTYQPRSSVKDLLVVCLDGNFQHRYSTKAGLAAPLVIPPIFLETERVDQVWELITNLADTDEPVSLSIVYPDLKIKPATYTLFPP
jgi:RNase P subunit RPR2